MCLPIVYLILVNVLHRIENEDRIRKGKKAKVPSKEKGEYGSVTLPVSP